MAQAEFYKGSDLTEAVDQTDTTFTNHLTVTANRASRDEARDFLVMASAAVGTSNSGDEFGCQIKVDDVVKTDWGDATNNLWKTSLTNDLGLRVGYVEKFSWTAASHTIKIDAKTASSDVYSIQDIAAVAWELPTGTQEATDASEDTSGASTSETTKVTLAFTPDTAQDYLLVWYAEVSSEDWSNSGDPIFKAKNGGTAVSTFQLTGSGNPLRDGNNDDRYFPFCTFKIINLAASSQSFTITYQGGGSNDEAKIQNARIYAIPLDDECIFNVQDLSETQTLISGTGFADITTDATQYPAEEFLFLGYTATANETAGFAAASQAKFAGDTLTSYLNAGLDEDNGDYHPDFYCYGKTITQGSITMEMEGKSNSVVSTREAAFLDTRLVAIRVQQLREAYEDDTEEYNYNSGLNQTVTYDGLYSDPDDATLLDDNFTYADNTALAVNWTVTETDTSEVDVSGSTTVEFQDNTASGFTKIVRDIGSITGNFTVDLTAGFLDLPNYAAGAGDNDAAYFLVDISNSESTNLKIYFAGDGIYVDAGSGPALVENSAVESTASSTYIDASDHQWHIMVFGCDNTSATCNIYRDSVIIYTDVDCSLSGGTDGEITVMGAGDALATEALAVVLDRIVIRGYQAFTDNLEGSAPPTFCTLDDEVSKQVDASAGDVEEVDDTSLDTSDDKQLVGLKFSEVYDMGFRWTGVNIPSGATINAAAMYVYMRSANDPQAVSAVVTGVDENNPAAFNASTRRPSQLTQTSASVEFSPASPTERGWNGTGDLSTVIQEIVDNNSGTGDAMSLVWKDNGTTGEATAYYKMYTYDQDTDFGAQLCVDYSVGGGPNKILTLRMAT